MKHVTNDKGDIGVARIIADLIQKGISVFIPVSSTSPFDLLGNNGSGFKRIQVKYRTITKRKTIEVHLERAIIANSKIIRSYNSEVDIIAIYCPETDKCYYVNVENGMKSVSLRVEKSKNNQIEGIRFIDDYLTYP